MQPALGDVFVTRTGGFVGWVIRKLTHSGVNHAGVYAGDGQIVEADPHDGLRDNSVDAYPAKRWLAVPMTDAQRVEVVKWSDDHLGTGYNFIDLAALFLALAAHIPTPRWAERRLSSDKHLICSQAAVMALRAAGVDAVPSKPAGEVTPADLDRAYPA